MKKNLALVIIVFAILLTSCQKKTGGPSGKPLVICSIPPLEFIAAKIGGGLIRTESLMGEFDSPHTYTVTPSKLRGIQQADLLIQVGEGFEGYLTDNVLSSFSKLERLDLAEKVELRMFETLEGHDHEADHEEGGEHLGDRGHSGYDPHIWLGIPQLYQISEAIYQKLAALYPEGKEEFLAGKKALDAEIKEKEESVSTRLAEIKNKSYLVFHPSYGYFADSFGFRQLSIEVDGKDPSPQALKTVVDLALENNIHTIISQPQFSPDQAQAIAEAIDGKVIGVNQLQKNVFNAIDEITSAINETK